MVCYAAVIALHDRFNGGQAVCHSSWCKALAAPLAVFVLPESGTCVCRIHWANPLMFAQRALIINEFTARKLPACPPVMHNAILSLYNLQLHVQFASCILIASCGSRLGASHLHSPELDWHPHATVGLKESGVLLCICRNEIVLRANTLRTAALVCHCRLYRPACRAGVCVLQIIGREASGTHMRWVHFQPFLRPLGMALCIRPPSPLTTGGAG